MIKGNNFNKINYSKELEKFLNILKDINEKPSLLLHSCCAPCSSYVLEYLLDYFNITVFYYNPNISPKEEFDKRILEQKRLILEMSSKGNIDFIEGDYDYNKFYELSRGLEFIPEGGERCFKCYRLRLEKTAQIAKDKNFEFFTTTLSISPYKNAEKLNEIGKYLSEKYNIKYLFSDFKKKNGYKRSIELSSIYGLYRQSYCGCIYSKNIKQKELNNKKLPK